MKRFYIVRQAAGANGGRILGLVAGVPDPDHPHDPARDRRDGTPVLTGSGAAFWGAALDANYVWVQLGFKRCWLHDPERAARVRDGQMTGRYEPDAP